MCFVKSPTQSNPKSISTPINFHPQSLLKTKTKNKVRHVNFEVEAIEEAPKPKDKKESKPHLKSQLIANSFSFRINYWRNTQDYKASS